MVYSIRKLKPSLTVIVLSAVLISILGTASATRINWQYNDVSSNYIPPGANDANITQFEIIDGNDQPILNTTFPGDDLHKFRTNTTMFLNQSSGSTQGLNGYNKGEDILRVDLVHIEGSESLLNGSLVGNFSSDLSFADGGYSSDGLFNGDQVAGGNSEAIIVSNTSDSDLLRSGDFVAAEGSMNFSNFSDNVQFSDSGGSGSYEASEALIRNSNMNGFLNSSDTVIRAGNAGLRKFDREDTGRVRFLDNDLDGSYTQGNAIVRYSDNDDFLESDDEIVVNGTANLSSASTTYLSYINTTQGGFQNNGEPVYFQSGSLNLLDIVNKSDVRIGSVNISPNTGLETVDNSALWNSSLGYGKNLYNDTSENTGYSDNGTFRVLEYGSSSDGVWNPSSGDQEVLIYDPSNDYSGGVSGTDSGIPDIYIYDSDPSNNNIPNSMEFGERFNQTQADNVEPPADSYVPDVNLTFDGSDSFYNYSKDNVTLNVSQGGNSRPVIIGPEANASQLGFEGSLHNGGYIRFWNASANSRTSLDGFYADMNESGVVDRGDVRIGEWRRNLPPGRVQNGDVDIGINLTRFKSSDDIKVINEQNDGSYNPGSGNDIGKPEGGREAIVASSDLRLDSGDVFVRSGSVPQKGFDPKTRFTGYDISNPEFESFSAIVENTGSDVSVLEDEDTILKSGRAFMKNLSDEVRYVENGSTPGFEQGSSEAIIYDSGADSIVSRGFLNSSPDRVIVEGSAGLTNFSSPPASRGDTGKVFLDSNNTGRYNQGEDIINITLVTNGSDSKKINGTKIFNFAESTKHNNQSSYSDGDAIINDTDTNTVYRDVLTGIEIENVYDTSGPIKEILDSGDIRGGNLELYRQGGEKVTDLAPTGSDPTIWSAPSFSEKIDSNTTYYVAFDPEESSNLEDKVYGIEAESSDISTSGSDSLTLSDCSDGFACVDRIVDNHAPEFKTSITGSNIDGNSSKRDRIYIEVLEVGAGLSNSFKPQDFNISFPEYNVTKAKFLEGDGDILLSLNDSLETNQTPEVSLVEPGSKKNGVIRDLASNLNGDDSIEPRDGLRPLIQGIEYLDKDIDGSIDGINVSFSERINYTRLDVSGWKTEPKDITCIQPLTPGDNAYLCPKESDKIDLVSNGASTLFQDSLGLESLSYVNSSVENSSRYEIGKELYNVTSSNTGYSQDGGFVLHEYSGSDGVLNPDGGPDQDVIVYSINGTALTPGDVLVYNQNLSNGNIPVEPGEEFTEASIDSTVLPESSFNLTSQTGFHGSNPYDPETDNVSVNLSYNSSGFDQPNSSLVSLTPEGLQALSPPEPFNPSGNVKFWNLSGNSDRLVQDGLFVDVNMTGNISDGDIRLGRWRLENKKQLYTHRIEVDVDGQTSGESLNNTLVRLESGSYDSIGPDNIVKAEISNSTRDLNVEGNITEINLRNGGKALNISFNTSKYDIQLDESDKVSISYYSRLNATSNSLDKAKLNSGSDGSTYDGVKQIDRTNRSEVSLNATAVEEVTGGLLEPVFNFTVLKNQISDQSGNTIVNSSSFTLRDSAAPATVSASTKDQDNDARIDRINVGLSEQIDGSNSNLSKAFEVSKGDVKSVINPASDDEDLRLNVSDVGGTASVPDLKMIKDAIEDSNNNTISENQTFDNVRDRANPLIINAEIDPVLSNSKFTFVDAEFSENVSGKKETNQSIRVNQEELTFNNTVSTENISINYSEVLQTGRHPNITSTVNLTDKAGNKLENLRKGNITVNTFRREMVEGWNFVSFPLTSKSDIRIDEIFDVSRLNAVWSYGEDGWSIYDPEAPENDFNTVQGSKGYIVNVSENFTLAPNVNNTITNPVQGQELDQYGTNLTNEWNLIGNTQEFNQRPSAEDAFVNVDAEVSPIYGQKYRNGSRIIDLENPVKDSDGSINERIIVGRAYWAEVPNGENQTYRVPLGG